jgi:hypothetical protein
MPRAAAPSTDGNYGRTRYLLYILPFSCQCGVCSWGVSFLYLRGGGFRVTKSQTELTFADRLIVAFIVLSVRDIAADLMRAPGDDGP